MVKIEPTSKTEYEVFSDPGDIGTPWHLGYIILTGRVWMFKPASVSIYGQYLLEDIAAELAKLNNTTLS